MIFNIIFALTSAFSFVHNVNTLKEDYNSSYEDCKVWGFEDGSWASKARWGAKIGLDSIGATSSGLLFVDSISGGNIRTKAVRDFLGGFDSPEDLRKKCSNIGNGTSGKPETSADQKPLVNAENDVTPKMNEDYESKQSTKNVNGKDLINIKENNCDLGQSCTSIPSSDELSIDSNSENSSEDSSTISSSESNLLDGDAAPSVA